MVSKKWITCACTVLLVVLLLAGGAAIAAELGGADDPLVSLSYIEQLIPQLNNNIEKIIGQKVDDFDKSIDEKIAQVDQSINDKISRFEEQYAAGFADEDFINRVADAIASRGVSGGTTAPSGGETPSVPSSGTAGSFTVVDVNAGQKLIGEVGTEILWRIGTASCVAPGSPGLIDISSGADLAAGGQLQQNHVYVVTVAERGFQATSNCKVLIKGSYTIQ